MKFCILILYFFEIGKEKKKKYKEKILDSKHCASGCWITRKPLGPLKHHVLYTTLEFTHKPFTCARRIKNALPFVILK